MGLIDWDGKIAQNRESIDAGENRLKRLSALLGGFTGLLGKPSVMDGTG